MMTTKIVLKKYKLNLYLPFTLLFAIYAIIPKTEGQGEIEIPALAPVPPVPS